jgi:carbon monoxide dehydrogenase subunit G
MRRVDAEALVGASRDEVWELLDDIAGMPRWVPGLQAISSLSGPAHVGTVFRERMVSAGVTRFRTWEIAEYRRPTALVRVAVDGGMSRTLIVTLDGRGTGTRVHVGVELRSTLPFGLRVVHELLVAPAAAASARSFVDAVKRAFEGSVPR